LISTTLTNGDEAITLAATARDACVQMVSQPRIDATDRFFPKSNQDARISLTAELFRWHLLPNATTNATVERDVWSTLRSDWRRAGVRFPEKFQVVLYHKANLQGKNICTHHTGLLFRRGTACTYLEKAGGKGPFVRLDFDEKSDLIPWMSGVFSEREHQNDILLVTFSDSEIIKLSK
jgi:hypothetical protein